MIKIVKDDGSGGFYLQKDGLRIAHIWEEGGLARIEPIGDAMEWVDMHLVEREGGSIGYIIHLKSGIRELHKRGEEVREEIYAGPGGQIEAYNPDTHGPERLFQSYGACGKTRKGMVAYRSLARARSSLEKFTWSTWSSRQTGGSRSSPHWRGDARRDS